MPAQPKPILESRSVYSKIGNSFMKTMKKIVVKLGTSTLTQGTQKLSHRYMLGLVQQIIHLQNRNLQVILVSSGAVAIGRELLTSPKEPVATLPSAEKLMVLRKFGARMESFATDSELKRRLPSKQALASVGQIKLMQVWSDLFALFDLRVGQVLLTRDDFSNRKRQFTKDTLGCLLQHCILPIINENDTIATKRTRVGDNDNLAALVANLIEADILILLTDQEGLYTADPRLDPEAALIHIVEHIDNKIFAFAGNASTSFGTGGMTTKIEAAQIASRSGTRTIIAHSARPNVLIDLIEGKNIGTQFLGTDQ
jgi:glutamate 5-kinase